MQFRAVINSGQSNKMEEFDEKKRLKLIHLNMQVGTCTQEWLYSDDLDPNPIKWFYDFGFHQTTVNVSNFYIAMKYSLSSYFGLHQNNIKAKCKSCLLFKNIVRNKWWLCYQSSWDSIQQLPTLQIGKIRSTNGKHICI